MRARVLVYAFVVAFAAAASQATTVTFVLRSGDGKAVATAVSNASLTLTPEPDTGYQPISVEILVPGSAKVELPGEGRWNVELNSGALWSRALTIVPADSATHTLDVVPAGVLKGRLRDEKGNLRQVELMIGFTPSGQQFPLAPDTSRCMTDELGRFACTVPLGSHDLRFKTPQRTPFYKWNQKVTAAADIGEVRVSQGGTIAGYLLPADLAQSAKDLRITVNPSPVPAAFGRPAAPSGTVQVGPNGFFSTSPLAPGIYDLQFESAQRGVANIAAIQVREGLEARLPRPVGLEPRVGLTVKVAPAQPPNGPSWQVELMRSGPEGMRPATRGITSNAGTFVAENLASGAYYVVVSDDRGSRWAAQPLSASPTSHEFSIDIPIVYVEGALRRGDEGLEGSLWFGGQYGTPSIRMEADEQGEFRGMLPRDGEWMVDVVISPGEDALAAKATVTVDKETNVARADVTIPDNRIEGIVVDTAGAPVPRADVTFNRGPQRLALAVTDAQGRFSVRGVTSGEAEVFASATGARSPIMNVAVDAGPNAPLRLVVHELPQIKSRVLGPAGPVPGARVAIWPEGGGRVSLAVTDSDGYFLTMGHPPTERLNLAVHSPGLALFVGSIAADAQQSPQVVTLTSAAGVLEIAAKSRVAYVEYGSVLIPVQLALQILAPAATAENELRLLRLADLPPGQYRACSGDPGTLACTSGWLAPGATLQLELNGPE
jgi:hypothetical protein